MPAIIGVPATIATISFRFVKGAKEFGEPLGIVLNPEDDLQTATKHVELRLSNKG